MERVGSVGAASRRPSAGEEEVTVEEVVDVLQQEEMVKNIRGGRIAV